MCSDKVSSPSCENTRLRSIVFIIAPCKRLQLQINSLFRSSEPVHSRVLTSDTMSRVYDTVEPSVVDEEMLQKAVEEQGPQEEAGRIAKTEGIDFRDVASLRLDFKSEQAQLRFGGNFATPPKVWKQAESKCYGLCSSISDILKIDNLWCFTSVTKLQLDNNIIEKIEGLDMLTNLVWLGEYPSACLFQLCVRTFLLYLMHVCKIVLLQTCLSTTSK